MDFDAAHGSEPRGDAWSGRCPPAVPVVIVAMYAVTGLAIVAGALTWCRVLVVLAAPWGVAALRRLAAPAPGRTQAGYVAWPSWFHRAFLTRPAVRWLFILRLVHGAIWPSTRL